MKNSKRFQSRFLDPRSLALLSSLNLIAKTVVEGFLVGLHRSPFHGYSAEFREYRPYYPGDDVRHVDWRVYARTDRYYVKRFEEETDLNCYLLLDTSASMAYKPGALSKMDYARFLAASLGHLITRQRDRISLLSISDRVKRALPPGGGPRHFRSFLHQLEASTAEGRSDLKAVLLRAAQSLTRKGMIILISDLYDDPPGVARALVRFRRAGHEVIVFRLVDVSEVELEFDGPVEFEDLETGDRVSLDARRARSDYARRVKEAISFYNRELSKEGIDLVGLDTSRPLDHALLAYLRKRAGRRL
ncbi:MAG TPA: DUF58 domain-containing protein [Blastocatellia bacterium]|nr:DUF58 domain-containing protein [Blastocatellia bacterium]